MIRRASANTCSPAEVRRMVRPSRSTACAQAPFEQPHVLAQRGLADVPHRRGLVEAAALGDREPNVRRCSRSSDAVMPRLQPIPAPPGPPDRHVGTSPPPLAARRRAISPIM